MTQSANQAAQPRGIWLFRHGSLVPNPERRFVGQRDIDLSDSGRQAFETMARIFAEEHAVTPPQAIFCSDLRRGIACADILRRAFRPRSGTMPILADKGFRELSLGAWEGLTKAEVEQRWPGALAERDKNWADYAPAGGESFTMLARRALMALVRARLNTPQGILAVIGHASFNRCVLSDYLALPLEEARRIPQAYGCAAYLENR